MSRFSGGDARLTVVEAARMLGMPWTTLERWGRAGRISSELTTAGARVFRRQDLLDRWVTPPSRRRQTD